MRADEGLTIFPVTIAADLPMADAAVALGPIRQGVLGMSVAENVEMLPQPRGGDYEIARFNALRHGVLSKYCVLPWEDSAEYDTLLEALVAEHNPQGPTEEHLVEELAGVIWRKRRLRLGESAAHHRALKRSIDPYRETAKAALIHVGGEVEKDSVSDAITATEEQTAADLADLESDQTMTEEALRLLESKSPTAYSRALAVLREDTREWWEEQLTWEAEDYEENQTPYRADADSLRRFLESEILPWYENRRRELQNRPLVRAQAFGEAVEPDRLERLARYEVHLDRKLERTVAMLLKLQELRGAAKPR
jgi:hypothetical protein